MIEASELRIGNYVQQHGYYFVVDSISREGAMVTALKPIPPSVLIDMPYNPQPIPLTIEIFLNSGFERYTKGDGREFLHHKESGFEVGLEFDPQGNAYFYYWPETQNEFQLQGVHELQNLFYQLNYLKEELDIKL